MKYYPVPAHTMQGVRVLRRIAIGVAAALAVIAYVWTAAVRAAPRVRQRKAESRARRRAGV
jgi:hypothetical protein